MAHINLLPWREEHRKEQTQQFIILLSISALLTAALILLVHVNIDKTIEHQNYRNGILKTEIKKLESQLNEIKGLEETKQKLLSRMDVIQSLQQKRPQIVHVFDEITRTVPEGIYLTAIKQEGNLFTITGIAESNGRVSAYMRNIDASEWLKKPKLKVIETKRKDGRGNEFVVEMQQTAPQAAEDEIK